MLTKLELTLDCTNMAALAEIPGHHFVMADPEGDEFCVTLGAYGTSV